MSNTTKPRINPLSRRPRQQRLVMAVRGGAGTGKSWFLRSMAEAGLGRLCIFDVERKTRLLPGVGNHFDGIEVEHPDELPEFIDWALSGEGREQNYGCYGLDSWAAYFSAKHAETIKAVRERTGEQLAQPSAEELAADQMVLQGVLRRLCMESGKSVVIVDQIPAKGNVTFKDFLEHMKREHGTELPVEAPKPASVPETIEDKQPLTLVQPQMTVQELVAKAERLGFKQADVVTGARVYHNQPNIYRLTPEQVADLDRRMTARAERVKMAQSTTEEERPAPRAQAARNLKR